jgi:ABC-type multidrug transport system ATPase subunit
VFRVSRWPETGDLDASLDARAEYAPFSSIPRQAGHGSVLLITHRLASVRHATRIYVRNGGRVTEQGTHAELLARGGRYAELYTLRASQYDGMGVAGPPAGRRYLQSSRPGPWLSPRRGASSANCR